MLEFGNQRPEGEVEVQLRGNCGYITGPGEEKHGLTYRVRTI